ncbi:MAG: reverse transcriptase domain-containing protein [Candidatus Contendobacter sp.]|nr:reverse transcriptase domain-containing protein [Candidatus Contendobacter sp.]MDS4058979.1 reverse transcriptase domain-containing protein [Candidatus Contendobacter sp.]
MAELLDRALSPAALNAAWKRLQSDKTVWRPGLPRWEMEKNQVFHLLELVDDLRSGRYRPAPLRQFTIEKGDGKQRVLSALSLRDKLIQRAVLSVLEPIGEQLFHNDSYGYRPRRNVEMAHRRACERIQCGLPWLVDADIAKFFDNIPHRSLQKTLKQYIPDRELLALIDLWLAEGASSLSFLGTRRGVAQGAVISPMLCNFYLHELDVALAGKNIPFVRFADDFLLFAPDERRANEALKFVDQKLKTMGLELHPEKTQVTRSHRRLIFLGLPLPMPLELKT